jgi:hypothetical protein
MLMRPMRRMERRRAVAVVGTAAVVGHHAANKQEAQMEQQQAAQQQAAPAPEAALAPAPAPAAAPAPAGGEDITAQLEQLSQLHNAGVLSDQEFAEAKQKVLAGG